MTYLPQIYEERINLVISIVGQDFVNCLTDTLSAMSDCIDTLMSAQPKFHETNLTENLRKAGGQSLCRGTHILILGNCHDMLNAGVLLLLTGYNGRALSCVRDVYEGLRFADACLHNANAAINWLDGKKPKKPKGHKYPDEIALDQGADTILNVWGTHPQYESTMSAWFSRFRLSRQVDDFDRFFVLRDIVTLLSASSRGLSYILLRHSFLVDKVSGVAQRPQNANSLVQKTMSEVVKMYHSLLETKKD